MSDFTKEQLEEIANSEEFKAFLEEQTLINSNWKSVDDFLGIKGNREKWEKRFATSAQKQKETPKPELTLAEIQQNIDALETTTNSKNDSALDEYFETLQKDAHDTLNDIVNGEMIFAEDTFNTPEAYETTKKFIENMVGGYFETSLGGQNNDVRLKEVHDKALAMLETARTTYEKNKQSSNETVTIDEQEDEENAKQTSRLEEDKEGDLEYLDLTEEERDTLREQYKGREDVLDYIRRMNPTERDEASAIDQYLMEFWRGKRVVATEEKQEDTITIDEGNEEKEQTNVETHMEKRSVPNMLMVVTDNREAGANHTPAELIAQLESINAAEHDLDADRLNKMVLAIKQSYGILSNQDVLDSFAGEEFGEIYTNVQNMPVAERTRRLETAGFRNFEARINGEDNTFARDRLLALYMLSEARKYPSTKYSLNNVVQNEADVKIGDFIAKNVYGYDDPVNPTSNGVRESYFTRDMEIEVAGPGTDTPTDDKVDTIIIDNPINDDDSNVDDIIPPVSPVPEPEPQPEPVPPAPIEETKELRERSADNFDNTLEMHKIELEVMHEKKLISDDDYNQALATFNKMDTVRSTAGISSAEEINKSRSMVSKEDVSAAYQVIKAGRDKIKPIEIPEYRNSVITKIFDKIKEGKEEYTTLLTPELVAYAIENYSKQSEDENASDEEKNAAKQNLDMAMREGEALISDLTKKEGYYFSDITNAADEYDGYIHLCNVCEEQAKKDGKATDVYETGRQLMEGYVEPYDKLFNIPDGNNPVSTAKRLNDRINAASEILDNIEFNEDNLGKEYIEALANYKFITDYQADGTPIYENAVVKEEKDGKLHIKKGSHLDTVLRFSANQAMLENLGNTDVNMTEEVLLEGAKNNAFQTLFAFDNAEQTVRLGLRENPQKFTDKRYVEEFKKKLMDGQTMTMSPLAFDLALKRQAHNVETYSNRVTSRLGTQNTQYLNAALLGRVAKIDKTSPYKDNTDFIKKKALNRQLCGAGIGGAVAFVSSYLMTKMTANSAMAKALANAQAVAGNLSISAELAAGGGAAAIGAVAGAAFSTLTYFGVKKITAMVRGQKYGWKDVRKDVRDPATWAIIGAGALSGASIGFALSGCPQCATVCGFGALAAGGLARFIKPYRDMRLHGYGKVKSTLMGVANAASVFAGGYFGRQLGLHGVERAETTITADEEKTKELYAKPEDQRDGWQGETNKTGGEGFHKVGEEVVGQRRVYSPEDIVGAQRRVSYWVKPDVLEKMHQDALQKGLSNEEFWEFANHSLLAKKGGLEAEFGTNNQYADNTVTGIDFETVDPLKIKQTDNHFLYGEETIDSFNKNGVSITAQDVETMGSFLDPKTGTVNMDAVPLLRQNSSNINLDDGSLNTSPGSTPHMNGHVPSNAQYDAAAHELQALDPASGKPDTFSSWHKSDIEYAPIKESLFAKFTKTIGVDPTSGFGTLVLGWKNKVKNFLRPGAKADKVVREPVSGTGTPVVPPTQPAPEPKTPPVQEAEVKPIQEPKTQPVPEPKTQVMQEPKTQPALEPKTQPAQDDVNTMLCDEYKIVHGTKEDPTPEQLKRYELLVRQEFNAERTSGAATQEDFGTYLYSRQKEMEDLIFSPANVDAAGKVSLTEDRDGLLSERKGSAGSKQDAEVRHDAIIDTQGIMSKCHGEIDEIKDKERANWTLRDFVGVMKKHTFPKSKAANPYFRSKGMEEQRREETMTGIRISLQEGKETR